MGAKLFSIFRLKRVMMCNPCNIFRSYKRKVDNELFVMISVFFRGGREKLFPFLLKKRSQVPGLGLDRVSLNRSSFDVDKKFLRQVF